MLIDIPVRISQNLYIFCLQEFISFFILATPIFIKVLRTVQFYGYSCIGTIEVKDVFAQNSLSVYSDGQFFQALIP